MNQKGFSIPSLVAGMFLLFAFVFMFPIYQTALDAAPGNFANFSSNALLVTMMNMHVILAAGLVALSPFIESQTEQVRRIGF